MFDWNGRLGLFSRSRHASIGTYSRIYDFVKVNSTFYVLPSLSRAEHWRKKLFQRIFEFTVRCNRVVSHKFKFTPTNNALTGQF
ncbi:hypothetical protein DRN52_05300 [Thermococci archaeon]|nr:MAG: hypothetical protein DRN52_05300 [Thermococci archaeon]